MGRGEISLLNVGIIETAGDIDVGSNHLTQDCLECSHDEHKVCLFTGFLWTVSIFHIFSWSCSICWKMLKTCWKHVENISVLSHNLQLSNMVCHGIASPGHCQRRCWFFPESIQRRTPLHLMFRCIFRFCRLSHMQKISIGQFGPENSYIQSMSNRQAAKEGLGRL